MALFPSLTASDTMKPDAKCSSCITKLIFSTFKICYSIFTFISFKEILLICMLMQLRQMFEKKFAFDL